MFEILKDVILFDTARFQHYLSKLASVSSKGLYSSILPRNIIESEIS